MVQARMPDEVSSFVEMPMQVPQIGNPIRVAFRQLLAATGGQGRLFAFGDPNWPEFIAIAPGTDGWMIKYGGYPLTAVDFSFGMVETETTEEAAYRLAMEVADNGDWAEVSAG